MQKLKKKNLTALEYLVVFRHTFRYQKFGYQPVDVGRLSFVISILRAVLLIHKKIVTVQNFPDITSFNSLFVLYFVFLSLSSRILGKLVVLFVS